MPPHKKKTSSIAERLHTLVRAYPDLSSISLLLVTSLTIRLPHLFRPLQGDELQSFIKFVLGREFSEIVFGRFDANNHLLNSLIMKAVYLCVGEIPALIRLPNLLFILLAIVFLYVTCSREFGRVTAFVAALIFSIHPSVVLYSVYGRGYAGMVFFTLISSYLFLQVVRSLSWWRLLLCIITGFLAVMSHLFAVNVLIAQALLASLVVAIPEKSHSESLLPRIKRMGLVILGPIIALAILVAIYLPAMLPSHVGSSQYSFQTAFPVALLNFMGGYKYNTDLDVISFLLLTLALIGLLPLRKNRTLKNFLCILFLTPMSLYALSYFAPIFILHTRFFVYLLPFYCLLFAIGLEHTAHFIRAETSGYGHAPIVVRSAVCLCVLLVAITFIDRIKVNRGGRMTKARQVVGEFIANHPDAHFLSNVKRIIRIKLSQEVNTDRIRLAATEKKIGEFIDQGLSGAVYYFYVPQKRYSALRLISYSKNKITPEELYRRDDELRAFITTTATIEIDLFPLLQIYSFKAPPDLPPKN